LLFTNYRNIVLALAGDRAGVAADAGREINHHPPLVSGCIFMLFPEVFGGDFALMACEIRITPVLCQRSLAHQGPLSHAVILLRAGDYVTAAGMAQIEPALEAHARKAAHLTDIETYAVSNPAGVGPSIAQLQGDAVIRLAWYNPDRERYLTAVNLKMDEIAIDEPL